MKFKDFLIEEFDNTKAVKDALVWLKQKYDDRFTFKNIPSMKMNGVNCKSYDINVGNETYQLNLRKFDSNGDGKNDTLGFDVQQVHNDPEPDKGDNDEF